MEQQLIALCSVLITLAKVGKSFAQQGDAVHPIPICHLEGPELGAGVGMSRFLLQPFLHGPAETICFIRSLQLFGPVTVVK